MKSLKIYPALLSILFLPAYGADGKPRIFLTESQALQVSGEAEIGETKGQLFASGPTSPQNIEVMRQFTRHCPQVTITGNKEKADYIVRFDHEAASPITPFTRGNKVAIFDKDDDLVYSNSTRFVANAVKDACAALRRQPKK